MALRVCGTFLSLLLLSVQLVAAQVRQISGRVTNAQTEQGLGGATMAVTGTGIVAETNNDGSYILNAPDGDRTLVVRAIGFKRQQVRGTGRPDYGRCRARSRPLQARGDRHHRSGHRDRTAESA